MRLLQAGEIRMGKLGVVIVAAGTGTRMQSSVSKQYLLLLGKPIIIHTLEVFQEIAAVDEMVLVVGESEVISVREMIKKYPHLDKIINIIPGGKDRQSSVFEGLKQLTQGLVWVMVHDGVRPFVSQAHFNALFNEMLRSEAAVLAVQVKETIKVVDCDKQIESTPDRSKLWAIQTPQAFRFDTLIQAHKLAAEQAFLGTDDAMLVERLGIPVKVVEGGYTNIKITTPDDLLIAESILKSITRGKERNE